MQKPSYNFHLWRWTLYLAVIGDYYSEDHNKINDKNEPTLFWYVHGEFLYPFEPILCFFKAELGDLQCFSDDLLVFFCLLWWCYWLVYTYWYIHNLCDDVVLLVKQYIVNLQNKERNNHCKRKTASVQKYATFLTQISLCFYYNLLLCLGDF